VPGYLTNLPRTTFGAPVVGYWIRKITFHNQGATILVLKDVAPLNRTYVHVFGLIDCLSVPESVLCRISGIDPPFGVSGSCPSLPMTSRLNFEVKMISGGISCRSNFADLFAFIYTITDLDVDFA
jgi:hypothetical protein